MTTVTTMTTASTNPLRRTMINARFAPGPIARWEWLTLAALCALALTYWIAHYHPYIVTPSDFPSFERLARSIFAFESPSGYKRMPFFPFLVGLVAQTLSMERAHVHAALGLNIAFSLGIIVMAFLVARRLIGPAALISTAALLLTHELHASALSPMVEPCLTFLILLSLYLFLRGSRWQYLAAALAAMTRYEASALIAIFFVLNVYLDRRWGLHLLLAAIASIPFVAWMGASLLHHDEGGNPYLSQMSDQGWTLAWSMAPTMFDRAYYSEKLTYFLLPLAMVGVIAGWRRFRIPTIAILSFGLLYLGAHIAFGVEKSVYAHPVLWLPPLFMVAGGVALAQRVRAGPGRALDPIAVAMFLGAGVLVAVAFVRVSRIDGETIHAPWVYYLFFACVGVVVAVGCGLMLRQSPRRASVGALVGAVSLVIGCDAFEDHVQRMQGRYYAKYEAYVGTEWLAENMKAGERALVFSRIAAPLFAGELGEQLVRYDDLSAEEHDELIAELIEREIDYVVYWRRKIPGEPGDRNYARDMLYYTKYKVWLTDPFNQGAPVAGFIHQATLPVPEHLEQPAVQIYRFLGGGGDGQEDAPRDENE